MVRIQQCHGIEISQPKNGRLMAQQQVSSCFSLMHFSFKPLKE